MTFGTRTYGSYVLGAEAPASSPAGLPQFGGSGSLSSAVAPAASVAAGMSSSGALTVTVVANSGPVASFSSSGILAVAAAGTGSANTAFAGTGTLSSATTALLRAAPAFGGAGQLGVATSVAAAPMFTASGALTAAVSGVMSGFTAAGQVSAGAAVSLKAVAGFVGAGQLTVVQLLRALAVRQLTGAGQLTAVAGRVPNSYVNPQVLNVDADGVASNANTVLGTTVDATTIPDEPLFLNGQRPVGAVWYTFTPSADGLLRLSLSYAALGVGTLAMVVAIYDTAFMAQSSFDGTFTVPVVAGRRYSIRVATAYDGGRDDFELIYSFSTVPDRVNARPALRQLVFSSGTGTSAAFNKPAGLAAGDLMLLLVAVTGTPYAYVFPSDIAGWDDASVRSTNPDGSWCSRLYQRVATAADVTATMIQVVIGTVARQYLATLVASVGEAYLRPAAYQPTFESGRFFLNRFTIVGDLHMALVHSRGVSAQYPLSVYGTRIEPKASNAISGLVSNVFAGPTVGFVGKEAAPLVEIYGDFETQLAVNLQVRGVTPPVPNYDQAHATVVPQTAFYAAGTMDLTGTLSTPPYDAYMGYWEITAGTVARHVRVSTIGTSVSDNYRPYTDIERYAADGLTELDYSPRIGYRRESYLEFDLAPGETNIIGIGYFSFFLGVVRYELSVSGPASAATWVSIPTPTAARSGAKAFT